MKFDFDVGPIRLDVFQLINCTPLQETTRAMMNKKTEANKENWKRFPLSE